METITELYLVKRIVELERQIEFMKNSDLSTLHSQECVDTAIWIMRRFQLHIEMKDEQYRLVSPKHLEGVNIDIEVNLAQATRIGELLKQYDDRN